MIKRHVNFIIFFCFAVVCLIGYTVFKSTERSRFAENTYKILVNVPVTGLTANKEQLEKIINYATKLEKRGDLESIRLCFSLRRAIMIILFTEMHKAERVHFGYSLPEEDPVSTGFSKDVFLELFEMNHFDEKKLIDRIPIQNNTIISNLYDANISVSDILSSTNFLYKDSVRLSYSDFLGCNLYDRLTELQTDVCMLTLNPIMETSDEQFVQTLGMIQDFRDLDIHAEVLSKNGFLWDSKQIKNKIDEIIKERGIVKRVDTFRPEKSSKIYNMLDWYNDESGGKVRVLMCLEPYMNNLDCLPKEYKIIFEKQRKWREEKKSND